MRLNWGIDKWPVLRQETAVPSQRAVEQTELHALERSAPSGLLVV